MKDNIIAETQSQKETIRLETFSDGVFCVAITLLAFDVGIKLDKTITTNDSVLLNALLDQWTVYFAYIISFVNVLLAWIGHHSLFKMLQKSGSAIMIANGLLLMLVALVPFPTKTLGKYLDTNAFKAAVIFYTGYFVLISVAFRLLWYAASRKRENLTADVTNKQISLATRNENLGLLFNSVIFGVAFFSPWLALILSFVMWIYWVVFA